MKLDCYSSDSVKKQKKQDKTRCNAFIHETKITGLT